MAGRAAPPVPRSSSGPPPAMSDREVSELSEQILQLVDHACPEEEEKLRTEVLEKLSQCKRDTLIELCRSFDIIGSRANRKEELVSFLMKFSKNHSSDIDGSNPDKKIKKRRRVKEEGNMPSSRPFKKSKKEVTALDNQDKEKADGIGMKDVDLKHNRCVGADNSEGKFPNEGAKLEALERISGSTSENLNPVFLNEPPVTNEQALVTNMKASKKKNSSITKKKTSPKKGHRVKYYGKQGSKGDTPRKQAPKPSKDELREAIFLILDTVDFATVTFGEVVKKVDKYFGKDLFERKPLIRSLIEEELFRLSEEAEKKELEEEEAEAQARAEQASKVIPQFQSVESGIYKQNEHEDNKTRDGVKKTNGNNNEKGGASVKSAKNMNKTEAASKGGNGDPEGEESEVWRNERAVNNAENINCCGSDERAENGKAHETDHKEDSGNVVFHGYKDGKANESYMNAEESALDAGAAGGKAEDTEHNGNTKVDVSSGRNGAENRKADSDMKGNTDS